MTPSVAELRTIFPDGLSATVEVAQAATSSMGSSLFIGLFVSLVFFAACCSLLYFRLFTEIEEDRKYFRRLQDLGAAAAEMKRLARGQAMVVFYVPFLAGVTHSTLAMKALGTLLSRTVLQIGWVVALAYLVLYAVYLAASSTFYWRTLRVGLK